MKNIAASIQDRLKNRSAAFLRESRLEPLELQDVRTDRTFSRASDHRSSERQEMASESRLD
jgi:hypothetical protein